MNELEGEFVVAWTQLNTIKNGLAHAAEAMMGTPIVVEARDLIDEAQQKIHVALAETAESWMKDFIHEDDKEMGSNPAYVRKACHGYASALLQGHDPYQLGWADWALNGDDWMAI